MCDRSGGGLLRRSTRARQSELARVVHAAGRAAMRPTDVKPGAAGRPTRSPLFGTSTVSKWCRTSTSECTGADTSGTTARRDRNQP